MVIDSASYDFWVEVLKIPEYFGEDEPLFRHWDDVTKLGSITETLDNLEHQDEVHQIKTRSQIRVWERGDQNRYAGLSTRILEAFNKEEQTFEQVASFPFAKSNHPFVGTIVKIEEMLNMLEAMITLQLPAGIEITFYDTGYYKNKEQYVIGQQRTFNLAAVSFKAELVEDQVEFVSDKEVRSIKEQLGLQFFPDSAIEEKWQRIRKEAELRRPKENVPDWYDFYMQAPMEFSQVHYCNHDFSCAIAKIHVDPDIYMPVYVYKDLVEANIPHFFPVRGSLWMQGNLAEN